MSQNTICFDTEIRKLRPAELYKLGQILSIQNSWKKLMAIIPKDNGSNLPKFNVEHFRYTVANINKKLYYTFIIIFYYT